MSGHLPMIILRGKEKREKKTLVKKKGKIDKKIAAPRQHMVSTNLLKQLQRKIGGGGGRFVV